MQWTNSGDNRPCLERAKVSGYELWDVWQENRDSVALFHAKTDETVCEPVCLFFQLMVSYFLLATDDRDVFWESVSGSVQNLMQGKLWVTDVRWLLFGRRF
jgi:hypothetical protein